MPVVALTLIPVMVAPETWLVKTPETPVTVEARIVFPVTVAPEMRSVNTPETPVIFAN